MSCLKILDLLVFVTLFKVIAKSLTDRLKPHLPTFIDQSQAAFIKNRHISSNIVITQEIVHSFTLKNWNQQAFLLKLDHAKAFDRLDWDFIASALNRLGLHSNFIRLIRSCISTCTFSILVNGEPSASFSPREVSAKVVPFRPICLLLPLMNSLFGFRMNYSVLTSRVSPLVPAAPLFTPSFLSMISFFVGLPQCMRPPTFVLFCMISVIFLISSPTS